MRRVKKLNEQAGHGQDELFSAWRHHPIFTDSPYTLIQAEEQHRDHAVQEQVNADLIDGPLAHLSSGTFAANAAWLTLAAITHNLLRALGCLASTFHARARGATLRRHLITVSARLARHGPADGRGHLLLHLPAGWRWQPAWMNAFAGWRSSISMASTPRGQHWRPRVISCRLFDASENDGCHTESGRHLGHSDSVGSPLRKQRGSRRVTRSPGSGPALALRLVKSGGRPTAISRGRRPVQGAGGPGLTRAPATVDQPGQICQIGQPIGVFMMDLIWAGDRAAS
nr:hypothetical protein [Nonomuraea zeae]